MSQNRFRNLNSSYKLQNHIGRFNLSICIPSPVSLFNKWRNWNNCLNDNKKLRYFRVTWTTGHAGAAQLQQLHSFQWKENFIPCVYMQNSNLADCAHGSWLRFLHLPIISIWITPRAVVTSTGTHPISQTANYLANLVCRYFTECVSCFPATSRSQCFIWLFRQLL